MCINDLLPIVLNAKDFVNQLKTEYKPLYSTLSYSDIFKNDYSYIYFGTSGLVKCRLVYQSKVVNNFAFR